MLTSYKNHGNDHFPRVYPINIPFISHWITIKWVFPRLKKPMGFSSFSFFEDSDSEGDVEIRPEDHVFVAASCDELGKLGRRGTYHGNMMENDGNPVWYITHRIHVCYIWGYYSIYMGMDQYLLIPFLVGWTSINPSYLGVHQGYKVLTHCHMMENDGNPIWYIMIYCDRYIICINWY